MKTKLEEFLIKERKLSAFKRNYIAEMSRASQPFEEFMARVGNDGVEGFYNAFTWDKTPEGSIFWINLKNKFEEHEN